MMDNSSDSKRNRDKPDAIFILGIEMRSGTNYLWQMLRLHPQCHVGSVGEDFLLQSSDLLVNYIENLYSKWTPEWRQRMAHSTDFLLEKFGDCLISFIKRPYYLYPDEDKSDSKERHDSDFLDKILLTKTPSIKKINLFFKLFPNSRLIILVRDGRSVVESGIRSFNWNFEDAVRRWNKAANEIIRFIENNNENCNRFRLVQYENLVKSPVAELKDILTFLGLDHEQYDFIAATNLHVFGSSDIKKKGHKVHWQKSEKTKDFSPLKRWAEWDLDKHDRFYWLAGEAQKRLGYSIQKSDLGMIARLKHKVLDWKWEHKRTIGRIFHLRSRHHH